MSAAVVSGEAAPSAIVPAEEAPVDRTKHPSGIVPVLQNVVATVDLGCKLELKDIALHARNAEYNPKVHPSAHVLVASGTATILCIMLAAPHAHLSRMS